MGGFKGYTSNVFNGFISRKGQKKEEKTCPQSIYAAAIYHAKLLIQLLWIVSCSSVILLQLTHASESTLL